MRFQIEISSAKEKFKISLEFFKIRPFVSLKNEKKNYFVFII